MNKPSKTVTSIAVVAVVIGLVTGRHLHVRLAGANPIVLFLRVFFGIFVLGRVLDRAARNASGQR